MKEYLLDTSTASFILNGNVSVAGKLRTAMSAGKVYCSVVTEGELQYGGLGMGARRRLEYLEELAFFVEDLSDVLPVTRGIASEYAGLRRELEAEGRSIPENDYWIAATALSHDMTLVAHDKHFRSVDALDLEDWLEP